MAIGDVTPKKLFQGALSTALLTRYTTPAGVRTQVTEIWIANTNTATERKVTINAHGTAVANTLHPALPVSANGTVVLDNCKIVLNASEVLALKQDVGADVVVTVYGIEEAIA